jgi:hypothetical protein
MYGLVFCTRRRIRERISDAKQTDVLLLALFIAFHEYLFITPWRASEAEKAFPLRYE